jgi:hypothetical protein
MRRFAASNRGPSDAKLNSVTTDHFLLFYIGNSIQHHFIGRTQPAQEERSETLLRARRQSER